ncbi:MAG: helix-turn-helix domain-containing protein, partial [Planctomycetota bacterium]
MTIARKAWTWRHAICKSDLPPTTRHVLHALSCWMNEVGGSCYPTTKELAAATGLSERAVCEHLEKAEGWGWLRRRLHGFKGRGYRRHEYEATFPGSGRGPESGPDEVVSEGEKDADALTQDQQVGCDALGGTAANINDDNAGTTETTNALGNLSGAAVASRIIAQIDYGSNKTITQIEAVGYADNGNGTNGGHQFFTSTDGTNWTAFGTTFSTNQTPATISRAVTLPV